MGNLFQGLESMGIKGLSELKIYEEEKKPEDIKKEPLKPAEPVLNEADFIFDKKIQCPVCDKEFKTKTVKVGKPRLIGSDSDLRPKYAGIDSIKYDAIVCPNCGYAALSRFFSYMTSAQSKLIRDNVSATFTGLPTSGDIYTYEEAINRHKLALYNTIVKSGKNSEKAYTCLKIAWLYRGMKENTPSDADNRDAFIAACEKMELEMIQNTFDGFVAARAKESFPICGMDTVTFDYLLADLGARLGMYEVAEKLLSGVITSRSANARLKEKARDLRDLVKTKITKE